MFFSYKYRDQYEYVPVHQNLILHGGHAFEKDNIGLEFSDDLYAFLNKIDSKLFVLDLDGINMIESRSMQNIKQLFDRNKGVIFINTTDITYNIIINAECRDHVVPSKDKTILGRAEDIATITDEHLFNKSIKEFRIQTITDTIHRFTRIGVYPLESSNVYSNMYIDVKKIFSEPAVLQLIVYELCRIFLSKFDKRNINGIICTSYNGACLATIVGNLLQKQVIYLMNLGPHLSIKDRNMIFSLKNNENYVYIYDFICLGTEYKLAKTVALLKNSAVVGAIGVSRHPDIIRRDENNHSIFIADSEHGFDYKISAVAPE